MKSRLYICVLAAVALVFGAVSLPLRADTGLCASVILQINQQVTLERQGFVATLGINNGQPASLNAFSVTLNCTDVYGNPVALATDAAPNSSALFYYRVQTGSSIPTSVPANTSQSVAFLIVPALGAAGTSPNGALYNVGATIQYSVAGVLQTVQVTPASITVQPMPILEVQYFLPGQVYGDDPMTPAIEPMVPFALGLRVLNHSPYVGVQQVKIQSSQPQIIDNKQGLLVNFQILGCQVNNAPAQPSLLVNMGNIGATSGAMANWKMVASLSGTFVSFTAQISHASNLGGSLTSLIPQSAINTHRLLGIVLVDLPGRDALPDFLATDQMSGDYNTVNVYESGTDQSSEPVDYFAPGNSAVNLSGGNVLSVATTSSIMYVRLTSPIAADQTAVALRSDGKLLPASNCWVSKTKDGNGNWVYWLNLFDTSVVPTFTYTLKFSNPIVSGTPPVLKILGGQFRQVLPGHLLTIHVGASDADNLNPILTMGTLPDGAGFIDKGNGTGAFSWTPTAAQLGTYTIQFNAIDGALTTSKIATVQVVSQLSSGLGAWQNRYWPNITDPSIIGATANPSGDGISNLLKYSLGGDPTIADDSMLPKVGTTLINGQHFLTITYLQCTDDPTLLYEAVGSNDLSVPLANWTVQTQSVTADQTNVPDSSVRVTIVDSVPIETGPTGRFLKLRVTQSASQ